MKDRMIKQVFSKDGNQQEREDIRKGLMKVNMVDVFYIHI
jgi:hypothetical protein